MAHPLSNRAALFVALCIVFFAGCGQDRATDLTVATTDVAMFRGGPAHSGRYTGPAPTTYSGLLWRTPTGGAVRSTPAVAGSRLFVGSSDGGLYAFDARTGVLLWRFPAATSVNGSPAVRGGVVYVTDQASTLYAVHAADGRLLWSVETGATLSLPWGFESGDVYASSPVVAGDTVIFGAGDGRVRAINAGSGEVFWSAATGGRVRSTPAVADGRVYVGSGDGVVYAFGLTDGHLAWRHETEGASLASGEFGFDRRTVQSSPAVEEGRVFVGARDGFLYALDAASGRRLWRFDHEISWVNSSPAIADGLVLVGSSDGQFFQAIEAATGEERWRVGTAGIVWTSPAVVDGVVVLAEGAGRVRGLRAATGETLWSAYPGGGLFGSPVPHEGVVYVGSMDGAVYALRSDGPATGAAGLAKAVFWDSAYVNAGWYAHHAELRDWLADRGYEVLGADSLAAFLNGRIRDGSPSAVVFALDHLPEPIAGGGRASVFRRYLDAGGTVVWPSFAPWLWRRDPATGDAGGLIDVDRVGAGEALDIDFTAANVDALGAFATPAGLALGLPADGWLTVWSIDAAPDLEVLARDEFGGAASWRRSYGGPPGTGLVRLWGNRRAAFDPIPALVAAELRPE